MKKLRLTAALSVIAYAIFWPLIILAPGYADDSWVTSNGNVSGNSVQFNWQGGTATYVTSVADGSTVSINVNNTIANCIGNCTPIPDTWSISINGQTFSGNTIETTTVSATVSGQVNISVYGIDRGFWAGWYGPIFSGPFITSPAPAPTPSTTTSPEPVQSPTPTPEPSPSSTSSPTPSPEPSSSPSASSTPSAESSPSSEPSPTQSPSAEPLPSPSGVAQPTSSPEPTPTASPTPSPTEPTSPSPSVISGTINENGILELIAPIGKVFDAVIFASYGTPNDYEIGQCHAESSIQKVAEAFLGKKIASILASNGVFGDPCGGTYKKLTVKLSYIDEVTPTPSPTPTPTPEPTPEPSPTPTPQPQPTPTPTPEPSSSPTPLPEPVPVPEPRPSPQPEPTPVVPLPEPTPTPVPEPTPPAPEPTPTPSPEETQNPADTPTDTPPSDNPSDTPSGPGNPQDTPPSSDNPPTDSSTDSNTDTEPTPTEEPSTPTSPEETDGTSDSSDVPPSEESSKPTQDNQEQQNQSKESSSEPTTTAAAVIAVLAEFKDSPVPASALAELGLTFSDLPPETPVDVRTDENGNAVIITAEVAAALELIENPSELIGALFEDPGQVLLALGNIGADMSPQEREEAQKMVIATVIAAGAAMNAVAAAGGIGRKG